MEGIIKSPFCPCFVSFIYWFIVCYYVKFSRCLPSLRLSCLSFHLILVCVVCALFLDVCLCFLFVLYFFVVVVFISCLFIAFIFIKSSLGRGSIGRSYL